MKGGSLVTDGLLLRGEGSPTLGVVTRLLKRLCLVLRLLVWLGDYDTLWVSGRRVWVQVGSWGRGKDKRCRVGQLCFLVLSILDL